MELYLDSADYNEIEKAFKLGFLDGFRGFVWHFMQGWWYRMLVDVKCYEFERKLEEIGPFITAALS